MENIVSCKGEFGMCIPYELYGVNGRMLVEFNQQMHTLRTQTVSEKLMSAADTLYYYRTKDADEKLFYQLKIDLDANRLRVHSDTAVNGKLFMLFIAQILRVNLSTELTHY